MKRLFVLFFILFIISNTYSALRVPSFFSDNMVLQQNSEVKIFGEAIPNEDVLLITSWNNKTIKVKSSNIGKWIVSIKTPRADNCSYSLLIKQGRESICINNIVFGEVWFCCGQSNMEMKMRGSFGQPILDGPQAIMNDQNKLLRICSVPKKYSCKELSDCNVLWKEADSETIANCSAAAFFFGSQLQKVLKVPVGLIIASWGGANIVSLMSKQSLEGFDNYNCELDDKLIKEPHLTPTVLFNSMVHPFLDYKIRGVIWYQGECNRREPKLYKELFKAMVKDWRYKWGDSNLPFYYAQIAPFNYAEFNTAFMREAQFELEKEIKNVGMISLLDVGDENNIHPSNKKVVGNRFAQMALGRTYNMKGIATRSPRPISFKFFNGKAEICFDNRLTTYGKKIEQFMLAGRNQVFSPAKAEVHGNKVIVYSDKVNEPIAVRYGFVNFTKGTLYGISGCLVSSFRSDNWEF